MANIWVTVTSSTKQAYNLAMLGARTLKHLRDVSSDQKMILRAKVVVKVISVSNAMYEGPAKSFVTGFGLLQCYVYQTYFYYKPSKYSPFTETHFCNLFIQSQKADK